MIGTLRHHLIRARFYSRRDWPFLAVFALLSALAVLAIGGALPIDSVIERERRESPVVHRR
jgi:hypothetical protein